MSLKKKSTLYYGGSTTLCKSTAQNNKLPTWHRVNPASDWWAGFSALTFVCVQVQVSL